MIRYEDTTKEIPVKPFTITDENGAQYEIKNIEISPVGIHFDMTAPNNYHEDEVIPPPYQHFTLSVELTDGTIIPVEDWFMGSHGNTNDSILEADFSALFDTPIPLEDIKNLIICDTVLPVK